MVINHRQINDDIRQLINGWRWLVVEWKTQTRTYEQSYKHHHHGQGVLNLYILSNDLIGFPGQPIYDIFI